MTRTTGSRFIAMLLAVVMVFSAMPMTALTAYAAATSGNTTEFAGGSGTEEDPYLISTKEHLDNVRNYLSAHFKMINDIEFTDADFSDGGAFYNDGSGWDPINGFFGVFDGGCFSIRNLYINRSSNQVGLFGEIEYNTAQLKNIALIDCDITGGSWVGGIVGYIMTLNEKHVTFENCHVSGSVTGNSCVGGICGRYSFYFSNDRYYDITAFSQCYNSADVTGKNAYVGGIVGCAISNECYADIYFSECVNTGTICGSDCVGGIVGYTNGYSSSASTLWVSGACISNSYNTGRISATAESGYAGGIVGRRYEGYLAIPQTYSIGTITGDYASKLVGGAKLTGSSHYYDYGYYSADDGYYDNWGYGKSDDELKNQSTYSGWDFDAVWTMGGDESYPYPELQCFALSGELEIQGNVAYLSTVTPDLSGINRVDDTFTYEWLIDDVAVSTGASYTLKASDIGKTLQCKVVGTKECNMGTLYSEGVVVSKATQSADPTVPELLYLDDKKFEISTVSTQEYSIDNINWQTGGVFENLDPNKTYTVYSRILENDLYLLGESVEVLSVGTDRRPLSGKVSIIGTARYGDTLSADVSEMLPTGATFSYEWRSGGETVGTESTYTITQADIGKTVVLYVKGTDDYIGTISSEGIVATKASVQLPNAPVVADKTNTTVTLQEKAGYEYSMDKVKWQDSPVFTGLSAATEYTFYQRVKETDTTFASKASNGTTATTLKNTVAAPEKPVVEKITNTSVTLQNVDGYEYSMDGITWQASNVFEGLDAYTEYSFCQRIAENKTDYASAQSGYTIVVTLKNTVAAPGAPTIQSATATSVTLVDIDGYEYSMDGETWQTDNVFAGLTTLETYTFYQRIKETSTDYTSATSAGTSFKVKNVVSAPAAPTLTEKTNNKITVAVQTGYEYSLDKTVWNTTGVFTGLQPNQSYTVYCRIPETDTHYASAVSNALTVTTLKNTVSAPAAPVLSNKTSNSVTLTPNSAYEYSKDGKTWQASNVFSGLSPNTKYTFYQRKAETNSDYASKKSTGLTVTTPKTTVSAPSAPALSTKTATSVTLVKTSGYEYSKDGNTWQSSNVFDGLKPNTQYSFYQRVAETDTDYASAASAALTTTTPKKDAGAANPVIAVRVTATSVTLAPYTGYEYSKDGTTWQKSNVFTGLTANTTYKFYQRIAETADTNASASSAACNVTTSVKSACSISPAAPIIAETTTSKVVLVAREGYEYSKNGTTWQTSNIFSGLSSNTSYTFYQRIAETGSELASAKSAGVTVKTLTSSSGTTAATNYDRLRSYINSYGSTGSNGNKSIVRSSTTSGGLIIYYALENTSSGIEFALLTAQNTSTKVVGQTEFVLTRSSTNISVYSSMLYYYSGSLADSASGTKSMNRSTYSASTTYSFYRSGSIITGSDFSENFNTTMELLCTYWDNYIYSNLGFGLKGLGFKSFSGKGSAVCDPLASYHTGSTKTRNAHSATCTTDGYTGDTYCASCGEKKSSGSVITCRGSHTYSNSCDKTCNTCGAERVIEHQYSNICDTTCNICNATRAEIEHVFDNECDETCNGCSETRKAPHIYDNSEDLICNGCGYERPPYTPGDIDGIDGVTDADAEYMLMYTFFPEDYPVNQGCDFNGDGKVNDADAEHLLMFTFFPEDYPLH